MSWLYVAPRSGNEDKARIYTTGTPAKWEHSYGGWHLFGPHDVVTINAERTTTLTVLGVPADKRHDDALYVFEVFTNIKDPVSPCLSQAALISLREVRRPPEEVPESVGDCAVCGKPVRHCFSWWTMGAPRKPIHEECWNAWTAACRPPEEKRASEVLDSFLTSSSQSRDFFTPIRFLLERAAKEEEVDGENPNEI